MQGFLASFFASALFLLQDSQMSIYKHLGMLYFTAVAEELCGRKR